MSLQAGALKHDWIKTLGAIQDDTLALGSFGIDHFGQLVDTYAKDSVNVSIGVFVSLDDAPLACDGRSTF